MNKRQFVERIKEMHPDASISRIIAALNEAINDFSSRTRILEGSFTQNTVVNQRFYELDDKILEITSIDVDNDEALRLVGRPNKRDIT